MFTIPKKTEQRLAEGIKKFKRVISNAKKKDLNESDTVTIITDMFSELFGYDKYSEVTSEYAIRSTYCDIAIKVGNKIKLLVECKAVGIKLKEDHVRQAIDYGTKEGVEWVVLTNASEWRVFKIIFNKKPVVKEFIFGFDFPDLQPRNAEELDKIYALSREGVAKSKTALAEIYEHISTVNKYMLGQLILDESTLAHLRRLLKKISPDIRVTTEKLGELIESEVLKRDILDPENTKDCRRLIRRKISPKPKSAAPEETKVSIDILAVDTQQ